MWKVQAFDFTRNKFRKRLSNKISADNVIAVTGVLFPVSTLTTEQEARRAIRKFREVFSNGENLSPSYFRGNTDIAPNNTTKTPFWEEDKVKVQAGEFREIWRNS